MRAISPPPSSIAARASCNYHRLTRSAHRRNHPYPHHLAAARALSSSSSSSFPRLFYSLRPLPSSSTSSASSWLDSVSSSVGHLARINPLLLRMQQLWTSGHIDKNKALVKQLQHYGVIRSDKVKEVMETIDRGLFVPHGHPAYLDSPMEIGYNATISAPHMHATCLELLKDHLQPGMRALDVGSGTGYLTACFAMMVGPQGCAVGVEHIPELVASSVENIRRSPALPMLKDGSLSMHVADGRNGWPDLAPYDAIHVGASAPEIPQPLLSQLKPGGRMVIPVGSIFQELQVVDKKLDGSLSVHNETSVRYVPLTSRAAQLRDY